MLERHQLGVCVLPLQRLGNLLASGPFGSHEGPVLGGELARHGDELIVAFPPVSRSRKPRSKDSCDEAAADERSEER